mgnify:CR=1 FL=1
MDPQAAQAEARADGESAEVVLATDDPSGRTVALRLEPAADGAVRFTVRAAPADLVTLTIDGLEVSNH